ncbi:MAG: helix-turn-helix domain-containing protein [Lachnospiraceae bacterium]|jgi:putative transcriptional regulator
MVVYDRLFDELFRRHLYKVDLEKMTGISGAIMARLAKNENVTVATLNKICLALDCQLSDIAEVVPDADPPKKKPG